MENFIVFGKNRYTFNFSACATEILEIAGILLQQKLTS